MDAQDRNDDAGIDAPEYDKLLELEDLESLLEELDEGGWEADLKAAQLPGDLQARLDEAQVTNFTELRDKIARLHASLESEDNWE